jgi:hypothetical protein
MMRTFSRLLFIVGMIALVGSGGFSVGRAQTSSYRLDKDWAHVPPGFEWGTLADSDFDAEGNLWVLYVAVTGNNGGVRIGSARDGTVIASIPASPDPTGSLPYGMGPESVSADAQGTVYAGIVAGMTLERYVRQ